MSKAILKKISLQHDMISNNVQVILKMMMQFIWNMIQLWKLTVNYHFLDRLELHDWLG